ncbi:hypothetical protein [Capnocytophaga canimorsus]|uniref:hypothetical protein n=1 Tax=Capnocytophaga canimorsus TaxID=28188 RepID=UPI0037D21B37
MTANNKLSDLMYMIPDAFNKQVKMTRIDPLPDGRYFDCDLYGAQTQPKEPMVGQDGYVYWQVHYCICFEASYVHADDEERKVGLLGIPKWLYQWYLQGRANYISPRQVRMV